MHGGFAHIAVNMIWFAAFGSPLAGRIGTGRMIIFWILTSVIAGLTHYAIYPESVTPLVGASGAISGMMGLQRVTGSAVSALGAGRNLQGRCCLLVSRSHLSLC